MLVGSDVVGSDAIPRDDELTAICQDEILTMRAVVEHAVDVF